MKLNLIDIVFALVLIPVGVIAMTLTLICIALDFVTGLKDSFIWTVYKNRKRE